jgi:hypothetical protein
MKIKNLIIASASAILLSSCALTVPFTVTNNEVGSKVGTSSTICLFSGGGASSAQLSPVHGYGMYNGIMLNKNFGIVEAAKNGKISKIGAVDIKTTSYVFFVKKEFIVSGE